MSSKLFLKLSNIELKTTMQCLGCLAFGMVTNKQVSKKHEILYGH
jgi:hypothetical protein